MPDKTNRLNERLAPVQVSVLSIDVELPAMRRVYVARNDQYSI